MDTLPEELGPAFGVAAPRTRAAPLGSGLIHRTWLATYGTGEEARALVHQCVNTGVFRDPGALMDNLVRVTEHLFERLRRDGAPEPERRCLRVLPARDGGWLHRDAEGRLWRSFPRIAAARSLPRLSGPEQAHAAARSFGEFARRLSDLPADALHETIPHFHDFERRHRTLTEAAREDPCGRAAGARAEMEGLEARVAQMRRLAPASFWSALPRRPVHHDCKLDNLLFDARSGEPLCVVDLDTVMPGTLASDFGELVRSSASTAAEDEPDPARVDFDDELFAALARGYREGLGGTEGEAERLSLARAGPRMTLMNAVRFLADHLSGDRYFRVARPGQNLDRARAQTALAGHMLDRLPELERRGGG